VSGIGSYVDGETGIATKLFWQQYDEYLFYIMGLRENEYREEARDYGSDIAIDTDIAPGDAVVYRRLDRYSGLWIKRSQQGAANVDRALQRVRANRRYIMEYHSRLVKARRGTTELRHRRADRYASKVARITNIPLEPTST
jgi:hypothetical protein